MKLVRQKTRHDCGVAVAAMLCEKDYACAAKARCRLGNRGMTLYDWVSTLERMKQPVDLWMFERKARLTKKINSLPDQCAVLIGDDYENLHWICVCDKRIYDPELKNTRNINSYASRNWKVYGYARLKNDN